MVGCAWIGRAKHKSSRAWRLRRGRDRGRRVVKDRGARERGRERKREREMSVLVVMVVLLGARRKRASVGGGEERRGAQRLREWWGERWMEG